MEAERPSRQVRNGRRGGEAARADDRVTDPRVGRVLGGYRICARVGSGGFGKVYRAERVEDGAAVALKTADSVHAVERLQREFEATCDLRHVNVVGALDRGEDDGVHFLVQELVVGQDCRSLVQSKRGPLPLLRALDIVHDVCQGLLAVHARGWVHRDVTPSNVLVDADSGVARLADFGIARPMGSVPAKFDLTQAHETIGTPYYMSPEQWARPKDLKPTSDLFMVAGCLYFLLRGRPPFDGSGSAARDFPLDLEPDGIRDLLRRAGHREADRRFQTAAAMSAAVDDCRRTRKIAAKTRVQTPEGRTMTTDQLPRKARFSAEAMLSAGLAFDARLGAYRSGETYVVVQNPGDAAFRLDRIPELGMREMVGATVRIDERRVVLTSSYYQELLVEVEGKVRCVRVCRPREAMQWTESGFANVLFSSRSGQPEYGCSVERGVFDLPLPTVRLVGLGGVRLLFRSIGTATDLCTVYLVLADTVASGEEGA